MTDFTERLQTAVVDRYRIERHVGEGGMATVYLAHDLKHDRPVALKVLRPELAAVIGAERFLAEIRTTANLQHPNILPLFDSGDADGQLFYVMPYVEGETLRDRIDREKQLPVDDVVRLGAEVAGALDYAHRQGVVHRDIKPENILLHDGRALVADFGIALALSTAGGSRMTETGMSVGTPAYMSPEQAMGGHEVTAKSDVYALGATLYEALVGEPPFTGPTAQAIIARLVTEDPRPLVSQRKTVPAHVEAAVLTALERLPADRFATAAELGEALEDPTFRVAAGSGSGARGASGFAGRGWRAQLRHPLVMIPSVVALGAIVAAVALLARHAPPAVSTLPPIRFVLTTTDSVEPIDFGPWPAAISPDGGTVVYEAIGPRDLPMLYALRTDELEAHPVPGTAAASQPYFSPDGQWLAFEQNGEERKVQLDGSTPVTITGGVVTQNGAAWTPEGQIVLGAREAGGAASFEGLSRVSAAGGTAVPFTRVDTTKGERAHLWPVATPDPGTVVFTIWRGALASSKLAVASLDDGTVTPLGVSGIRPLAVLEGHLVYVQADGAVMAVPFDVRHERVTGAPARVHDPVSVSPWANGNSDIFVSTGGGLIAGRVSNEHLVWKARDGAVRPAVPGVHDYRGWSLAPDGRRVAAVVSENHRRDVWIWDGALSTFSRLTTTGTVASVAWTRDGSNVVYVASDSASHSTVWSRPVVGGSPPTKLFAEPATIAAATLSPDGTSLVVDALRSTWDLLRVPLDSAAESARPYVATPFAESAPRFSPDGRWVAYMSTETNRPQVYVRSFPDPSTKVQQVSTGIGFGPRWSRDGRRLYYLTLSNQQVTLLDARVTLSPTFHLLGRDTVMSLGSTPGTGYAVSPDGSRVLYVASASGGFQLVVSPNWMTELEAKLKGKG